MTFIFNYLWKLSCFPAWYKYKKSKLDLESAQQNILSKIIKQNEKTTFGAKHAFYSIVTIDQFRKQVPISKYDEYIKYIKQIGYGKERVLVKESVDLFEPTSGSTAATKLIPYTSKLRKDFQKSINVWIYDLFSNYPSLMGGSAYWSISPIIKTKNLDAGNIPVGFDSDSSYLGNFSAKLVNKILAVPEDIKLINDISTFRYVTLLFLLARKDLRFISVWNPTFLTLLFDQLENYWPSLLKDLKNKKLNAPKPIKRSVKQKLLKKLKVSSSRIRELQALDEICIKKIWPYLNLVSCWKDGSAINFSKSLKKKYLENIELQGKGLIATEGIISFPLHGKDYPNLAYTSHFFEFLPEFSSKTLLAHELKIGQQYEIIITTNGGLYRYNLEDKIEVMGYDQQIPLIRFIEKSNNISDLFGEKISEGFISMIINQFFNENNIESDFYMVAPEKINSDYRYILFINTLVNKEDSLDKLNRKLDDLLRKNYHYDYCRELDQLKSANIQYVQKNTMENIIKSKNRDGVKLGDLKPQILSKELGWMKKFNTW